MAAYTNSYLKNYKIERGEKFVANIGNILFETDRYLKKNQLTWNAEKTELPKMK